MNVDLNLVLHGILLDIGFVVYGIGKKRVLLMPFGICLDTVQNLKHNYQRLLSIFNIQFHCYIAETSQGLSIYIRTFLMNLIMKLYVLTSNFLLIEFTHNNNQKKTSLYEQMIY